MTFSEPDHPRVVALLRGINVGGHHKVPMADLRGVAQASGLTNVQSYIQSGNVIATDPLNRPQDVLEQELSAAIQGEFGFMVPVVVISAQRLRQVLAGCPWPDVEDPRCVHAVIHSQPIPAVTAESASALITPNDSDAIDFDAEVLWLHTPQGISKSRVAERLMRSAAPDGRRGTARNLRSLREIAARL